MPAFDARLRSLSAATFSSRSSPSWVSLTETEPRIAALRHGLLKGEVLVGLALGQGGVDDVLAQEVEEGDEASSIRFLGGVQTRLHVLARYPPLGDAKHKVFPEAQCRPSGLTTD